MTDEFALYHSDQEAWARLVVGRWLTLLDQADDERLLSLWRIAREPLKRQVWQAAGVSLKRRIKEVTSASQK